MKKRSLGMAVLALVAGLGGASSAHATWTFSSSGSLDSNGNALANTAYTGLTISGVYAANGGSCVGTMGTSSASCSSAGFGSGATWTSQALTFYAGGGLAMSSDGYSTPNHALDNGPATNTGGFQTGVGNTEAVLLNFSSSTILSNVALGYASGDSDFSVFRYVGSGTPPLGAVSTFTADLSTAGSGWELVGNYNGGSAAASYTVNSTNLGSSWWLISAYNTAFGGTALTSGNDYFKIASVAGSLCGTGANCGTTTTHNNPEPGSLALVMAAMLGLGYSRQRFARG